MFLSLELVETVAKESIDLINNIRDLDPNDRIDRLKRLGTLLTETLKRGEEKVALAKTTFDAVSRRTFLFRDVAYNQVSTRWNVIATVWMLTW